MEIGEDIELGVQGFGYISLEIIAAGPAEGLTLDHLKPRSIDATPGEELYMLGGEVGAGDRD